MTDNAANIIKTSTILIDDSSIKNHIRCFVHIINLVAQSGLVIHYICYMYNIFCIII